MRMVVIAYNEAVDEEVMEALKVNSIENYTKWTKVMGKGTTSGPHLLNNIWPKGNNVLMSCVQDGQAQKLLESVRKLRKTVGNEGVKAFSLPVDDVTS